MFQIMELHRGQRGGAGFLSLAPVKLNHLRWLQSKCFSKGQLHILKPIIVIALAWALPLQAESAFNSLAALRVWQNPTGGVWVEWERATGPERMAGWHVERQLPDGRILRITDERVDPGLFDPPTAVYRISDASNPAQPGDYLTYRLVTIDLELRERPSAFGIYVVGSEAAVSSAPQIPMSPREDMETPAPPAVRSSSGNRVRIGLKHEGLYRLTAAQIATVLTGYSEAQVAQAIAQTNFALSCAGTSVAWRAESGGGALLFFGQAYRDLYTDRNVYWLEPGSGLAMGTIHRTTGEVAGDPWFWETARAESNLYFRPYLAGGLEDDYFIWDGKLLTSPTTSWQWTTNVSLTDLHTNMKQGAVTAHLIGDSPTNYLNHTKLYASSQLLDDRLWAGRDRLAQSGLCTNLSGTSVTVKIELFREASATSTLVYVDALDVRYARRLRAKNNQLLFQPEPGTNLLTVRGFSNSAIRVFDVLDPFRPVEIVATVAQEGASWRASWATNVGPNSRFLAVATNMQPDQIAGVYNGGWDEPMVGVPHLVIAPQGMTNAAAALVEYRGQQGLESRLVPVEELYDAFAHGRRDPRAVAQFLAYARTNWTIPPAYVCLAGDGHLDYYDHFGQALTRPNHLPPIMKQIDQEGTPWIFGLDNPFADTDGDDMPEFAVGRLPAQTTNALTRMIDRIKAYESGDDWKTNVLLIADYDAKQEIDFKAACERLADRAPPAIATQHLNRTSTALEPMRTSFISQLNKGVPLAIYLGHGNNIALGDGTWFFRHTATTSDVPALTNRMRAPLLLAGTCLLNNFSKPAISDRCIGKGFLDTVPGGAIAVWASAAEAPLSFSEDTSRTIMDELYAGSDALLGDLIHAALEVEAQNPSPWLVNASVLLGDPGSRIRTHLFLDQTPPAIQIVHPTNGPVFTIQTNRLDLTGTASDSNGIWRVVVRNDRGANEFLAAGTINWSLEKLPLQEGTNWIEAVAYDSANHSATAALQVVMAMMPPVIRIHTPTTGGVYSTTSSHLNLAGTATDYSGVGPVTLQNSRIPGDWKAAGTSNWFVTGLALAEGTNWIFVTAADPYGNSATTTLQVVNTAAWTQSEVMITGLRKVPGGLELVWPSVTGRLYRIDRAYTMTNRFEPLEPLILATNQFGIVGLPGSTERQMYFRVFWIEGHDN